MMTKSNKSEDHAILIYGQPLTKLPKNLYIPPDALEILLDVFKGPLDLLLYLIKKHNINIFDINISIITKQYTKYINFMQQLNLELAGEYLLMAAQLAEIKSKLLLPRRDNDHLSKEEDPRATLVKRLQEYQKYQQVAEKLWQLPQRKRDIFPVTITLPKLDYQKEQPELDLANIIVALKKINQRTLLYQHHTVKKLLLSINDKIEQIINKLSIKKWLLFEKFIKINEGKAGVIVTFIALLQLLKTNAISIRQAKLFGQIEVKKQNNELTKEEKC